LEFSANTRANMPLALHGRAALAGSSGDFDFEPIYSTQVITNQKLQSRVYHSGLVTSGLKQGGRTGLGSGASRQTPVLLCAACCVQQKKKLVCKGSSTARLRHRAQQRYAT
jgi:hypothetical protein